MTHARAGPLSVLHGRGLAKRLTRLVEMVGAGFGRDGNRAAAISGNAARCDIMCALLASVGLDIWCRDRV